METKEPIQAQAEEKEIQFGVVEIFRSIQGEGAFIGIPVTFVRLTGCNLRCPWCDSKETWKSGKELPDVRWLSAKAIISEVDTRWVVITGGEPTLQPIDFIIDEAHASGISVAIETNATRPTPEGVDWVVASPKPEKYEIAEGCAFDELKYVVDEEFSLDVIPAELHNMEFYGRIWLQPCDYGKEDERTARMYQKVLSLCEENEWLRAGIQLHKIYNAR